MKRLMMIASISLAFIGLVACSNDEETAEERLQTYVNNWEKENFSDMYQMIANQEAYETEAFVDRYEKIYNDVEVTDLSVDFQVPETEEDEPPSTFPLEVSMNTIAGQVQFEQDISLTQTENEEGETNWYVQWDPGFIFPALANGGDVGIETTSPTRGEIYDRNENGLAVNAKIYSVGVQPSLFENEEEEKQKIADMLDIAVESIDEALAADWVGENTFVPLKDIPTTDEAFIEELFAIPSVVKQDKTGRSYPYGKATAHLVGYIGQITAEELEEKEDASYTQNDMIGKRGLEQLFEAQLKGERGVKIVAEDESESEAQVIAEKPAQDGENITVTIDAKLQQTVYNSFGEDAGTASVLNPKTGETLALVSSPAFDPNELTYGISQSKWKELQNDEQSPLTNRFAATFSPGSSIKPITSAIGLSNGTIKPDESIEINGLTWSKDGWGNYAVRRVSPSSGPVDLTDALVRSDNIYFAQKAVEMGSKALVSGLQNFGFGEDFPYTYPIETSTISSSGTIDEEILLADSGYGQGQMQVSSLHLATAYTTFLNQGNIMQPTLKLDEKDSVVWKESLLSSEHADLMKGILRQIVTDANGTANQADIDAVNLSGKTGTAELKASQDETGGQENGWFVAYPDDESMLISMMVEHVEDRGGSHYTVEKVADIFNQLY